jgi:hypothetical protein
VLSELKMYADEWPEVVNMVQSVLNSSLSTRLNKRTPMQVFTRNAETTPLALMLKDNVLSTRLSTLSKRISLWRLTNCRRL